MTFTAAAGWGNLPIGNWDPVIYSKEFIDFFRRVSVADEITNNKYAGEITGGGSSVIILKEPELTVSDYARGLDVIAQDINDEALTLTIDQAKYIAFAIDDIESKMSHVDWFQKMIAQTAYKLKDNYDANILDYMGDNGTVSATALGSDASPVTVGFDAADTYTPLDLFAAAARVMDENDIPFEDRFALITPALKEYLYKEDSKLIEVSVTGDRESEIRLMKQPTTKIIHGFKLYMSNNLPVSSTNSRVRALFGHKSSTATANALTKTEQIRNPKSFGDIYRSLLVFGRKVIRPEGLFTAHITLS